MVKIYKQPFAHDGDAIAIPDASQPDGKMSNVDGWTPDYQLPKTNPNYKPVGRQEMNGVFREVTEALGQVQVQGSATWSADGAPYPINALVYHNGEQWLALRANSVQPVKGADWSAIGTATTRNVGTASGDIMEVGAFGWGATDAPGDYHDNADSLVAAGFYKIAGSIFGGAGDGGLFTMVGQRDTKQLGWHDARRLYFRGNDWITQSPEGWSDWFELYHTGNATKSPDGTLKASSPVINLYTDKHDLHNEDQFGATPAVVRKSKGVYEITGTLGLRSEGWYLDTPHDRNGNKYFNIEWTQNITPDAEDGVVSEYRDDIVVTIETFERVWDKDTGMFDNGAPIDINELQDRFVQLRFNEIKVEHEELPNDPD